MKPETAYEVHSCLVDALETGTGAAATKKFGLQKFPAAGKTGTAYDFTEALFAGYDSAITWRSGPDSTSRKKFIAARSAARSRCRSGSTS